MTYSLRTRPDGQTEIVELRPAVVATFADEDIAQRVLSFLLDEAGGRAAAADPAPAPEPAEAPADPAHETLPAVVAPLADLAPADAADEPTDEDFQRAFLRIQQGEKLSDVALSMGVAMQVLRGKWAQECRMVQRRAAEAGQIECAICHRPFTPSLTSSEHCARCARD
ncbi:hypothetical protein [Rhodovulum steppense]|uniref:Uncharacterized protein n=1 Tax=Rhodovulum steppense TaxID=540251 RepID=A0A4R1YV60_9RHOB|nr:hypothetical protein [Rhodovulum steppense]TCM84806.1 hypothetical protein EV216_110124 [Rhodovulum steppense]